MSKTLNEDDVLKEIDRWIGYLDEDMITRIKIGIKKLPSAQPSFSCDHEKDHIAEVSKMDCISRQAAIKALHDEIVRRRIDEDTNDDGTLDEFDTEAILRRLSSAQPEQQWIPCSERLPEEDHWLGGSGRQFSDEVLVSVANYDDEDIWTYISQTIDGEWALELPSHCKIIAWMPLPAPWKEGEA